MKRTADALAAGVRSDAPQDPFRRQSLVLLGAATLLGGAAPKLLAGDPDLIDPYSEALEERHYGRPKPFIALYRRRPYTLGFVAALHGVGPKSKTFADIDRAFDLVRPAALVVEGFPTAMGENWQPILAEIAHRKDPGADPYARGEDTYAASIALERGVPFHGGELIPQELLAGLLQQGFDPQNVFWSSMISRLGVDARDGVITGPADPRFAAAFDNRVKTARRDYPASVDTGLPSFRDWYTRVFGRPIEADPGWAHRADPTEPEIAGRIAKASMILRDRNAFNLTIRLLNDKQRVLMVYGASHLSSQWRALKGALGAPTLIGQS